MIVVGGFVLSIILINFPENAKFLSKDEKQYVTARINHDIGRVPSARLSYKAVLNVFRDWRVWCLYLFANVVKANC